MVSCERQHVKSEDWYDIMKDVGRTIALSASGLMVS